MTGRSTSLAIALVALCTTRCVCGYDVGERVDACVELQTPDAGRRSVAGPVIADADFTASGFCNGGDLAHSVIIEDDVVGAVRFAWGGDDLAVAFADGDLAAEFDGPTFNGSFGFTISDADGVAVAVTSGEVQPSVPGLTVEHGDWRGVRSGACGTMTAHAIAVRSGAATTQVELGEASTVIVDDVAFTFHAFSSGTLDPGWHCTDSSDQLSWALIRD